MAFIKVNIACFMVFFRKMSVWYECLDKIWRFEGKHGLTDAHFLALRTKNLDVTITLNEESIGYDWMLLDKVNEVMKHDDEKKAFILI